MSPATRGLGAERLAARLARERNGRNDEVRSLSFGAYLTTRWLPGKRAALATSTWDGYRRKIDRHILPTLGRIAIRRLRPNHLEDLYTRMLHPTDGYPGLAPKTVLEVHLIIRAALNDAVRKGLVTRNVALVAHAPRLRSIPKVEQHAWTAEQLKTFLRAASGHRFFAAFWVIANTGMRRSELLGLRWSDVDLTAGTLSINRGLVAVAYEVHESRGKTRNSRRQLDLDPTTVAVLAAWHDWQHAEHQAVGLADPAWMFTDTSGAPIHPHTISQAFGRRHPQRRRPSHPAARRAPHARHVATQGRRARKGRERATRSHDARVHDRDVPTRTPRNAGRSRPNVPGTRHSDFYRPHPREGPEEDRLKTREAPASNTLTGAEWWRGEDLNLRPSGYEPDELPDCSTPRRAGECTDRRADHQSGLVRCEAGCRSRRTGRRAHARPGGIRRRPNALRSRAPLVCGARRRRRGSPASVTCRGHTSRARCR